MIKINQTIREEPTILLKGEVRTLSQLLQIAKDCKKLAQTRHNGFEGVRGPVHITVWLEHVYRSNYGTPNYEVSYYAKKPNPAYLGTIKRRFSPRKVKSLESGLEIR